MQKRMRYNISNLDTRSAETGIYYKDLPDIYAIMISQFDIFNLGKTVYYVDRVVRNYNQIEDNGIHELYINAKGKDITYLSELMQYIQNSNGYNDKFPKISERVRYLKEENEGVEKMGKSMEAMERKGKQFSISNPLYVVYSYVWLFLRPLRNLIYPILDKLNRLLKKKG